MRKEKLPADRSRGESRIAGLGP